MIVEHLGEGWFEYELGKCDELREPPVPVTLVHLFDCEERDGMLYGWAVNPNGADDGWRGLIGGVPEFALGFEAEFLTWVRTESVASVRDTLGTDLRGLAARAAYTRAVDWNAFGAIATAAATVVALGFGVSAELRVRKAERQLEKERELREEERRARRSEDRAYQARRVTAWLVSERVEASELRGVTMANPIYFQGYAVVQNASQEPVWDVTVVAPLAPHPDLDGQTVETLGFAVVPPETTVRRALSSLPPDDYMAVPIHFWDNRHQWWRANGRSLMPVLPHSGDDE